MDGDFDGDGDRESIVFAKGRVGGGGGDHGGDGCFPYMICLIWMAGAAAIMFYILFPQAEKSTSKDIWDIYFKYGAAPLLIWSILFWNAGKLIDWLISGSGDSTSEDNEGHKSEAQNVDHENCDKCSYPIRTSVSYCPNCGCSAKKALKSFHKKQKRPEHVEKLFSCNLCGKQFASKNKLFGHLKVFPSHKKNEGKA